MVNLSLESGLNSSKDSLTRFGKLLVTRHWTEVVEYVKATAAQTM